MNTSVGQLSSIQVAGAAAVGSLSSNAITATSISGTSLTTSGNVTAGNLSTNAISATAVVNEGKKRAKPKRKQSKKSNEIDADFEVTYEMVTGVDWPLLNRYVVDYLGGHLQIGDTKVKTIQEIGTDNIQTFVDPSYDDTPIENIVVRLNTMLTTVLSQEYLKSCDRVCLGRQPQPLRQFVGRQVPKGFAIPCDGS